MSRQSLIAPTIVIAWTLLSVRVTALAEDLVPLPAVLAESAESSEHAEASQNTDQSDQIRTSEPEVLPTPVASDDTDVFIEFPEEETPLSWKLFEAVPTALTWPDEPLGCFFQKLLHSEHLKPATDLEEHAIGPQPIPKRPQLILDLNERFVGPGFLNQGIELPTGAIWRPSLWVFGQSRTALQYFDNHRDMDPVAEWANRLDLFAQLNLSGTERLLVGLRPLDEEEINRREFTSYQFNTGDSIDAWNAEVQTLFFEGDFGEIFPWLDPYDSRFLDYGFSVGRMPLLAQQGLLVNEDMIDAVTVTRNTLSAHRNLNLRMTGVYAWDRLNRNSPTTEPNTLDPDSQMLALLTESDFFHSTVNFDVAYVYSDDQQFDDVVAVGVSAIQRIHGYHNTYNTSLHALASFPTNTTTAYADQGELLFAQTSWTPHHTEDLIYLNGFLAIDQFTSPTRGPLMGSPLGQTGLTFAAPGLGRAGAPVPVRTDNTAGASLGYQIFLDHTRQQVIWEVGGQKEYKGRQNQGAIASIVRFQQAIGQHYILVLDGFVGKREGANVSQGTRAEILVKF